MLRLTCHPSGREEGRGPSAILSSSKIGGHGVGCSLENDANRSRELSRRWAQTTLHVDSRLRGNDNTDAANSIREVRQFYSVPGPESRMTHSRGKLQC